MLLWWIIWSFGLFPPDTYFNIALATFYAAKQKGDLTQTVAKHFTLLHYSIRISYDNYVILLLADWLHYVFHMHVHCLHMRVLVFLGSTSPCLQNNWLIVYETMLDNVLYIELCSIRLKIPRYGYCETRKIVFQCESRLINVLL